MEHEGVTRRLAAIVAADMVGYSRLMQLDEAGTVTRQKACLEQLITPKIKEYGGRLVKTTGDGLLIEFPSAVDAVLCAVTMQREMADREVDIAKDRRIQYRIGINLGEIIHDGGDIFGDGVNVAARLEALAEPGGIRISEAVFNNVKGKLDLGFSDLGPQKVKNIAEPIPTYQVLLDPEDVGKFIKAKIKPSIKKQTIAQVAVVLVLVAVAGYFAWNRFAPTEPTTPAEPRLLVLPFANETDDANLFANGATDNFISSFALLKGMTVVPRSVALQYKGMDPALDAISNKLGFQYVLDGKVGLEKGKVKVSARLRNALDTGASEDNIVWQETLTGGTEQAFELFAKLKKKTTASMNVTLNAKERELLESVPTSSMEAYLLYDEARRFELEGHWIQHKEALELYDDAVAIDPEFMDAKIGYARVNQTAWSQNWNLVRYTVDALDAARETIQDILASDPEHPEANALKILMQLDLLDREGAVTAARSTVFKHPDEPALRFSLGRALLVSDYVEDARDEFDSYMALSPRLRPRRLRSLSRQYLRMGYVEKALSLLPTIQGDEAYALTHYILLAEIYARLGNIEVAQENMRKVKKTFPFVSLAWFKPFFDIYINPQVYDVYAKAMTRAGMPEWPHDLDKKLKPDRLGNQELKMLFASASFKAKDAIGSFDKPMDLSVNSDGSIKYRANWLPDIELSGTWNIKGDQVCYRYPALFMGREFCNPFYLDSNNSTDGVTRYIQFTGIGPLKFAIERIED